MVAAQRAVQQLAVDLAEDIELLGGRAGPPAGRLAVTGVVVLDALPDGAQVVVGLSLSELADRKHPDRQAPSPQASDPQASADMGEDGTWCKCVTQFMRRRSGA